MLLNTKGFVLHQLKYSDTSLIIKIFTEEAGIKSFILKGAFSKKSKAKHTQIKPLSELDLICYTSNKKQLSNIKEYNALNCFSSNYFNIYKSSIIIFLNEILNQVIKEEEPNKELYQFIKTSLDFLDNSTVGFSNFHILFLFNLTKHLGFYPNNNYSEINPIFNLEEGFFVNKNHNSYGQVPHYYSELIHKILNSNYSSIGKLDINSTERRDILKTIIDYYKYHISGFRELKSLQVLESIFT